MNSALTQVIKFVFLIFFALGINAEKTTCVSESSEIETINYVQNEGTVTSVETGFDLKSFSLPAQFRIHSRSVCWMFPNAYRKLFLIKALLFERYFKVHKIAIQKGNLAIVTQPQTDYYLYTLSCLRI